jgi:hypothetical protein
MQAPENGIEFRERRDLNTKHYKVGEEVGLNGVSVPTMVANIGVGHVHYFNKLGVGDSKNDFRSLDWTLSTKEGGGWTFLFHSFHPTIPQYADDWLLFRDVFETKDQTVGFKPVCSHVEGRLVSPENLATEGLDRLTSVNAVMYDSAFGEGIDYVVYFTATQMKKCVRIKSASKITQDYDFKFEIQLPEGITIWRVGLDGNGYELDDTRPKDFDSDKRTELRTVDGSTFFKPFIVWDSEKSVTCVVSYSTENGKKYLTKHVPYTFMETSVGDVLTDTTTSYTAGSGDGNAQTDTATGTWYQMLDQTTAKYNSNSSATACEPISLNSGTMAMGRTFFPFPTSGIGAGSTITAASVYLAQADTFESGTNAISLIISSTTLTSLGANKTDYTRTNWGGCTSGQPMTNNYASKTYASIFAATIGVPQQFSLSAAGYGTISKTGNTYFSAVSTFDYGYTTPGDTSRDGFNIAMSEHTTSGYRPYLSVTYTPAPSTNGASLMNLL